MYTGTGLQFVNAKKKGAAPNATPRLTHESTLLFYNSFGLLLIITYQLYDVHAF
jgi:hypothetical protein